MANSRPVAFITGASSGIGRAIAVVLSRTHDLVLAARRARELEATATLCRDASVLPLTVDVADVDHVRGAIDAAWTRFGRLDVLINNAAIGRVVSIEASTPEELDRTFRTNTLAVAWAIHFCWPKFVSQHAADESFRGVIVNISSMATVDPFPGFFGYAASKAAVNLLAASADKEGRAIGVRAFAVAPGAVETAMLRAAFPEQVIARADTLDPGAVATVVGECVSGRRDHQSGRVIHVLPESARAWFRDFVAGHPPIVA